MGINYVPRKEDGSNVIKDKHGIVTKVLPEYNGTFFSVTFNKGKPVCIKTSGISIPRVNYIEMVKQATAIYWTSVNKRFDDSPLHLRVWPKPERKRLDALLDYKCKVMPDGFLEIERLNDGKIVEMPYEDIDSAIRAQYHTIENYQKNLYKYPELLEEINRKIDFISNRRTVLVSENELMQKNIYNSVSVMNIMLASGDNFFKGTGFDLRLKEIKYYLSTVWLNPLHKQAKRCLSLLNSPEIEENPRKVIRSGINSLDINGVNSDDLIKSLAEVSKNKNAAKIFKLADTLLPPNCLKRYKGTIQIYSLLKVAEILESNKKITLNQICIECGRKRYCPA